MCRPLLPLLLLAALLIPLALAPQSPAVAQSEVRLYLPLIVTPPPLVASYLGGAEADRVSAADLDADGRLILAGSWGSGPIGGVTAADLPGGAGAVVRLGPGGRSVAAAARVGGTVRDMEVSASGVVVACGDMGVVALQGELGGVAWSATPGDVARCSAGAAGSVAALVGKTIYRYGPDGSPAGSVTLADTGVADVAIDDASGLVFATGYNQKSSNLKVAFLRAYDAAGAVRWSAYDFSASAVSGASLGADSEGRRVTVGRDGMLYLAGWTDGGNSIYGRDPGEIGRPLGAGELIKFDVYNNPFNISGARSLAWYGRFEPATGALLRGQWLLTRLSDGRGNSISIRAIDADADGTLAIAGDTAASIQGRTGMRFADVTLGGYEGGEPFLLVVSPDMGARRLWTAFAAPGTSAGGSPVTGVAIGGGLVGLGATLAPRATAPARGLVTTPNAPQGVNASPAAEEGYYLLMQRP
jgi:hypothetical protein